MEVEMNGPDLSERVRRVISETLLVPVAQLADETLIKEDLGADSMQAIALLISLDEEFDVEFQVENLPPAGLTVGLLCQYVSEAIQTGR